jgi:hypothetical protein
MANEFFGFGHLNFFSLVILNGRTLKCVIGSGCGNFKRPMEMAKRWSLVSMFNIIGLCMGLDFFFKPMGLLDLVVYMCFLIYIE